MMTTVVNIYKEKADVYIGRPSKWGNPFTVEKHGRAKAIKKYESYIRAKLAKNKKLQDELLSMDGKKLGCFCKPKACHGDVLVKIIKQLKKVRGPGNEYPPRVHRSRRPKTPR